MQILTERLRKERSRCNISQKMVSIKLGVAQSAISAWESGQKLPSLPSLVKLADMYGVTTDYLLGKTETPLSLISSNTPYAEVSPFERRILDAYRALTPQEQQMICRMLGISHPADERLRASKG